MKVAHLIMAHKAPAQLERLLQALAHPEADVFVHLDQKTDFEPFASLAALPNVQFVKNRHRVTWGGYNLTKAALESMREILQLPATYDFINVLSGEDYPIKPMAEIHDFLAQHMGCSFLEYERDGSAWWAANRSRATQYHFTDFSFRGRHALEALLNRVLPPRKLPELSTLYGGNMGGWYALSRAAAAYVVNFMDSHPKLERFARLTWGSDEFVVPSILLNSPLAGTVINNNLRYIDWSGGGSNPKVLTCDDLPALAASSRLFARKFDSSRDGLVLDQLEHLNSSLA